MTTNNYLATNIFDADGVRTSWEFSFAGASPESNTTPYLSTSDVKAAELYIDVTGNQAVAERTVMIDPQAPNVAKIAGPAVAAGRRVKIYRQTEIRFPLVDYRDRQSVSEADLDLANRQAIFVAQETRDAASDNLLQDRHGNYDAKARRIVNTSPGIDDKDVVNVQQLKQTVRAASNESLIELPGADARKGKVLTFDPVTGQPSVQFPATSSALDLEMRLRSRDEGDDILTFVAEGPTAVPRSTRSRLRDTVSVLDYLDERGVAFAFTEAFKYGRGVEVPSGVRLTGLDTQIVVPDGRDVVTYGELVSSKTGSFAMMGSGEFFMQGGGLLNNVHLKLFGGSPRVKGFRACGRNYTTAILIQGTGNYRNVVIDDIEVFDANYGVLRQGEGSAIAGCHITNGRWFNLRGDAIEWNICPGDSNTHFIDHVIDLIDSGPNGPVNWGIGIGVAGSSYDNTYPDSKTVKDFTIAHITGKRCRQLVHVENGARFEIADINGYDISDIYSPNAGIATQAVAVYGSTDFSVHNVTSKPAPGRRCGGINIGYGVSKGAFIAAPQNFTVGTVDITDGDVLITTGNTKSTVTTKDITVTGGKFEIQERPGKLIVRNVKAMRPRGLGPAFIMDLDLNVDGKEAFRARQPCSIEVVDCEGVDEFMADSCRVTGMVQNKVVSKGNNYEVTPRIGGVGRAYRQVNREYFGDTNGLPYGREYVSGDCILDSATGKRYIITAGGSFNRGGDRFEVQTLNGNIIMSQNLQWTAAYMHETGHRIKLPGMGAGGADLITTVVRCYSAGGRFLMELSNNVTAAAGATGVLEAATVATYIVTPT